MLDYLPELNHTEFLKSAGQQQDDISTRLPQIPTQPVSVWRGYWGWDRQTAGGRKKGPSSRKVFGLGGRGEDKEETFMQDPGLALEL